MVPSYCHLIIKGGRPTPYEGSNPPAFPSLIQERLYNGYFLAVLPGLAGPLGLAGPHPGFPGFSGFPSCEGFATMEATSFPDEFRA